MAASKVLFAARAERWDAFRDPLTRAFAEMELSVDLATDHPPESVDYIVYAPNAELQDFSPFTRLKAVFCLWAGVEDVLDNATLTAPLCRMVDPGLTEGMVEYVAAHTLRYHLGIDAHIAQKGGQWKPVPPPLACNRRVSILGLGALGSSCAKALRDLNFDVTGWSRSAKSMDGIRCVHGDAGLTDALRNADILVLLLPQTPATENVLNADRLALLPRGAVILNPGRGALIDDDALLSALDRGQVGHATLDVFRVEPLPQSHPFWRHPRVTVTPHIASISRPESCARVIADNIARAEAGMPLLHPVDRAAGY